MCEEQVVTQRHVCERKRIESLPLAMLLEEERLLEKWEELEEHGNEERCEGLRG